MRKTSVVMAAAIGGGAILMRLFLFVRPEAGGSTVFGVHVHHMLFGLLFACLGGIPAILMSERHRLRFPAILLFAAGLGLALDEWVLFVIRETAPDAPYMSTGSVLGAVVLVAFACGYCLFIGRLLERRK